ncbi:MAG: methyltransferase domain-containing protein [Caulobacter sp.]|nr:methyltransferase domain-containing protein [Caulobacter sp.]
MTEPQSADPNADQIAYWNDKAGETWARLQGLLDRQIAPLGARAMAALDPRGGETLLDIGCGCGDTTLALARAVGGEGAVAGVDISLPMLQVAGRRIEAEGLTQAGVIEADAQIHDFGAETVDGVFSRFGVMFFHQPEAAFANFYRALKRGGRLAFVCWRPLTENPWMLAPLSAALKVVPAPPPPTDPLAPGPFAFSDPDRVRTILAGVGFSDIVIKPYDLAIGGHDLENALLLAQKVGPGALLLRENPDRKDAIVAALKETLQAHLGPDGVFFESATWIVTAHKA